MENKRYYDSKDTLVDELKKNRVFETMDNDRLLTVYTNMKKFDVLNTLDSIGSHIMVSFIRRKNIPLLKELVKNVNFDDLSVDVKNKITRNIILKNIMFDYRFYGKSGKYDKINEILNILYEKNGPFIKTEHDHKIISSFLNLSDNGDSFIKNLIKYGFDLTKEISVVPDLYNISKPFLSVIDVIKKDSLMYSNNVDEDSAIIDAKIIDILKYNIIYSKDIYYKSTDEQLKYNSLVQLRKLAGIYNSFDKNNVKDEIVFAEV